MKRKETRKERGTRKEINCKQQKEKPIGRYNERKRLINLRQRGKKDGRKVEFN